MNMKSYFLGEMALKLYRDLFKRIHSTFCLLCNYIELGQKQDIEFHRTIMKGLLDYPGIWHTN